MKQVQYVLQFKGKGGPKKGAKNVIAAKTAATDGTITTSIGAKSVDAKIKAGRGKASFKSEIWPKADGTFTESGTITFAGAGSISFSTRGVGAMGPSKNSDLMHGAICWQVDKGTGIFKGASGIITSNFTFSKKGEVVDNQWGVIFLK